MLQMPNKHTYLLLYVRIAKKLDYLKRSTMIDDIWLALF